MAKYTLEVIMPKGNTFRDIDCTLTEARLKAINLIKNRGKNSYVFICDGTWDMNALERIDYDEYINDWVCQQYRVRGKKLDRSRRYRLSAKTGKLLDWDKYWRYL